MIYQKAGINMEYSINQLAKLARVSTRTLRYYDEIRLLSPKRTSSNGYRVYGQKEDDNRYAPCTKNGWGIIGTITQRKHTLGWPKPTWMTPGSKSITMTSQKAAPNFCETPCRFTANKFSTVLSGLHKPYHKP
jgi:hypothetical protein